MKNKDENEHLIDYGRTDLQNHLQDRFGKNCYVSDANFEFFRNSLNENSSLNDAIMEAVDEAIADLIIDQRDELSS